MQIEPWTLGEIAEAVGGELERGVPTRRIDAVALEASADAVLVDAMKTSVTPSIVRGIFVAPDRHPVAAVTNAVASGYTAVLVERDVPVPASIANGRPVAAVRVANRTAALRAFAIAYRSRFRAVRMAVVGANAPLAATFLSAALRRRFRVAFPPFCRDSATWGGGEAPAVFAMRASTERLVAVMSCGIGDATASEISVLETMIDELAMVLPEIVILTPPRRTVAGSHTPANGHVSGLAGILIDELSETSGTLVIASDDPHAAFYGAASHGAASHGAAFSASESCRIIRVGTDAVADVRIRDAAIGGDEFRFRGLMARLRVDGYAASTCAQLAAAAASVAGLDPLDTVLGLHDVYSSSTHWMESSRPDSLASVV